MTISWELMLAAHVIPSSKMTRKPKGVPLQDYDRSYNGGKRKIKLKYIQTLHILLLKTHSLILIDFILIEIKYASKSMFEAPIII